MSFRSKLARFYFTIRPLRWQQIVYRLFYRLRVTKLRKIPTYSDGCKDWIWSGLCINQQTYFGNGKVRFLARDGFINSKSDWNDPSFEKLWLYNLHYFDDLVAIDSRSRFPEQLKWVKKWINHNPPQEGNGWEPYPISIRLVNWIKWYRFAQVDDVEICNSIAYQASFLCGSLEYHIYGNHLFANAKALVFCGCFLRGELANKCLKLGLEVLDGELTEQFLNDGGHFERSPMYHSILLWDLLDLIQLSRLAKVPLLESRHSEWSSYAVKALDWLSVMLHLDGELSFFNDSANGIAPAPAKIFEYAKNLGLPLSARKSSLLSSLSVSGYSRVEFPSHYVIFDHAPLGPSYLLGHAHADTLSIEWSVGLSRVLVNSGTSIYGVSLERLRQRKTAAHNTVSVDKQDSSEVWSGFRVARSADATLESICVSVDGVTLKASHNGYLRLKGRVIHRRELVVQKDCLNVRDHLSGSFGLAEAVYHLHPNVKAVLVSELEAHLTLSDGSKIRAIASSPIDLIETTWHPKFGESLPTRKLCIPFSCPELTIAFTLID